MFVSRPLFLEGPLRRKNDGLRELTFAQREERFATEQDWMVAELEQLDVAGHGDMETVRVRPIIQAAADLHGQTEQARIPGSDATEHPGLLLPEYLQPSDTAGEAESIAVIESPTLGCVGDQIIGILFRKEPVLTVQVPVDVQEREFLSDSQRNLVASVTDGAERFDGAVVTVVGNGSVRKRKPIVGDIATTIEAETSGFDSEFTRDTDCRSACGRRCLRVR